MGLFNSRPKPLTAAEGMAKAGQMFGRALSPIAEQYGYISEENQILDIMKGVDMSNPQSFTDTFNALLQVNAEAASEFRAQGMPILQANMTSRGLDLEQDKLQAESNKSSATAKNFELDREVSKIVKKYDLTTEAGIKNAMDELKVEGLSTRPFYKQLNDNLGTILNPSFTAENQADKQERKRLIDLFGEEKGNKKFLDWKQKNKEDEQAAGSRVGIGVSLFKEEEKRRAGIDSKLSSIKSAINIYTQAKAGSPAAAKIAENIITNVFDGKTRAQSEIERIASAGGLVENIPDFINDIFSGVKTQEHYNAFLKVLDIYQREQESGYNNLTDAMMSLSTVFKLGLPESVFMKKKGKGIRKYNPKTGEIE